MSTAPCRARKRLRRPVAPSGGAYRRRYDEIRGRMAARGIDSLIMMSSYSQVLQPPFASVPIHAGR
jgi:hypothetical protein